MHQQINNLDEAVKWYSIIIKRDQNNLKSKLNLSKIYIIKEEFKSALKNINEVLKIEENIPSCLSDQAFVLLKLNKLDEAFESIQKSLIIEEHNANSHNTMGLILMNMEKNEVAIKSFNKAIILDKKFVPSLSNLGRCYEELNMPEKALEYHKKALEINPDSFIVLNNIAGYYLNKGLYKDGLKFYLQANKIQPYNLTVISNISKSFFLLDEFKSSIKYIKDCLKKDPENDEFKKSYSLILFKLEKYEEAWLLHEGRLNLSTFKYKDQAQKINNYIFTGKNIFPNDKILIIREQGIGDEILYASMYVDLIKIYKNVFIESDPKLLSLFKQSMEINNKKIFYPCGTFSKYDEKLKMFDVVMYAGSLGKIFRNSFSNFLGNSYLHCNKEKYTKIKKDLKKINNNFKIGISWKSFRIKKSIGISKSIDINKFKKIIDLRNLTYINLQYGDIKNELNEFNKLNNKIIHTLDNIDIYNDLDSLSALLKNLDLFISNSNTTAHLAGALGVETYLIKPKNHASFHYWNQQSNSTPWYSSIKLFDGANDWDSAIEQIKCDVIKKFNIKD